MFQYTEQHNIPGLLLLIDFEKAFDSVNWGFMYKCLKFYNFGTSIISWIKTFYNNIKTCVVVNGQVSDWFNIHRGCRQGDPLSPYIFIICAEILSLMIKNNKDIKGVTIGEHEFLISQYADDTSLILDGTEKSLQASLLVLKAYANASGLHVNIDKTKVVWFGSRKGYDKKLCCNQNMYWTKSNEDFTVLGIKFNLNLRDMVDINYNDKLRDIKALLIQWSKRILTPYGRLVVIKSLALAKINHLLISLPNPPDNFIKELDGLFFKYLWNGKRDKVKRSIVTKQYRDGGLQMITLSNFIDAIKTSWVRRLTLRNLKCLHIIKMTLPNIEMLSLYGADYVERKLRKVGNIFWRDTLSAYLKYRKCIYPKNWQEFLCEPIWYNPKLKVGGNSIAYNSFIESGIFLVNDLVDSKGRFYDIHYLQNTLRLDTHFLQYNGLIQSLDKMRTEIKIDQIHSNINGPVCPISVLLLTKEKKGCRRFYSMFTNNKILPSSQIKWNNELMLPNSFNWQHSYTLPYTITTDSHLQWLQFRFLHRILGTNTYLFKIGITNNNRCTFCGQREDNVLHLFWECNVTQGFIQRVENWLKHSCHHLEKLHISREDLFLGKVDSDYKIIDKALNFILLVIKDYIFKQKYKGERPYTDGFKRSLKYHFNTEKYISVRNCEQEKFKKRWMFYENLFEN